MQTNPTIEGAGGSLIAEIGTISIRTSNLDDAIHNAVNMLGLTLTGEGKSSAYLAAEQGRHHELVYTSDKTDSLDHIGLVARDAEAMRTIHSRVSTLGLEIVSTNSLADGVEEAFSFVGPGGFTFEIYRGMTGGGVIQHSGGFGPDRYGHINIHPQDVVGMKDFLVDVLGFYVSDVIGKDFAYFLRCNAEHHGIALIKGQGTIHHHAWQTQSLADLGRLADRLDASGRHLIWGPVRHGAGHNMAAYFEDTSGMVIELYCDMEHIYDELRDPVYWNDDDPRWFNRWMGDFRPEVFRRYGIGPTRR